MPQIGIDPGPAVTAATQVRAMTDQLVWTSAALATRCWEMLDSNLGIGVGSLAANELANVANTIQRVAEAAERADNEAGFDGSAADQRPTAGANGGSPTDETGSSDYRSVPGTPVGRPMSADPAATTPASDVHPMTPGVQPGLGTSAINGFDVGGCYVPPGQFRSPNPAPVIPPGVASPPAVGGERAPAERTEMEYRDSTRPPATDSVRAPMVSVPGRPMWREVRGHPMTPPGDHNS